MTVKPRQKPSFPRSFSALWNVLPSLFSDSQLLLRSQTCMDKHQVVGVLRQMEKFLKGQEMRFTEGLRIMKSKLATLQNSVSKLPQADQSAGRYSSDPGRYIHLHKSQLTVVSSFYPEDIPTWTEGAEWNTAISHVVTNLCAFLPVLGQNILSSIHPFLLFLLNLNHYYYNYSYCNLFIYIFCICNIYMNTWTCSVWAAWESEFAIYYDKS